MRLGSLTWTVAAAVALAVAAHGDERPVAKLADASAALADVCAAGRLDATLDRAFGEVVESAFLAGPRDADLVAWLRAHPALRDDALLAVVRSGSGFPSALDRLRHGDETAVLSHPDLAIAFAAAWSEAPAEPNAAPLRHWRDGWNEEGRDVPTMEASFAWFVRHEAEMRVPLRGTPWPVLAFLADSFTPPGEREWATARFGERPTSGLRDLFGLVPYTLSPKRSEPCTLESYLRIGGPCTHNVQFADGVFDAFGIPSGWSGGPGHVWPVWFESDASGITFHRTNVLGNRTGTVRSPVARTQVDEDDLRLLAASCSRPGPGRRRADAAAWAVGHVPPETRDRAAAIVVPAVRADPFCGEALRALATATSARRVPAAAAGAAWREVADALGPDHLDFLVARLAEALAGPAAAEPAVEGDTDLLDSVAARCDEAGRKGLGEATRLLRARCLESRGRTIAALTSYLSLAGDLCDHNAPRFEEALDGALRVVGPPGERGPRLDLLRRLAASTRPATWEPWDDAQRSHAATVRRLADALRESGDAAEADRTWLRALDDWRPRDGAAAGDAGRVGGKGGAAFEDTLPGHALVGLRVTLAAYEGRTIVGSVQALFEGDGLDGGGARNGGLHGRPRGDVVEDRAPAGWRVAGLVACGSGRLDGFSLLFVPDADADAGAPAVRFGPWHGTRFGREILLGAPDARVTGVRGRSGDDVDALGLVLERAK